MEAQSATADTQASGPEGQHGAGQAYKHAMLHVEASQLEQKRPKDFNAVHCMVRACLYVHHRNPFNLTRNCLARPSQALRSRT